MRVLTTPWVRARLGKDDHGTLRVMLPDEYTLSLSSMGKSGPWRAGLGTTLLPPSSTGGPNLAIAWSSIGPMKAAVEAVRTAAGEGDGELERRLADSLRMIGHEPKAVAS